MIKFRLKVMLAIHEMTQKDLTAATGIRQATISAIATGNIKELPVGVLDKLCATFNCQPGDLMEYIPDAKEEPQE